MDEKEKKLREDLEFHLDTLRRNLEVVSMEDLKAKYAKPFKELKDNICKTATAYTDVYKRQELEDAIAGDKTGQGFICDMFLQELRNHEYSYTGDVQETLDALGITAQYMEAVPQLLDGLALACEKAMQHDCFD